MPDLPTGTVTFLLTDLEGSTALWEREPAAMAQAAARHDAVIEQTVAEQGGIVVRPRGEGDSRFAVFARASDAVAAALALQWDLVAEPWPTSTPLRVRLALHTGEAELRDGDYYGTAVNRCARLRAVAHGGQALVSQATAELVQDTLPGGAGLQDLGEHRLRDLVRPDHIYQLVQPGVPATFPPLRSLDTLPNNLPVQLTSFVGREHEVAEVGRLLAAHRLVTLTGVGGGGKTRLALQVAADQIDAQPDGVWFVDLAPLTDPDLVGRAVAGVLGIIEQPGQPMLSTLLLALRNRQLLLLLDNCEHLLDACANLAEALLQGCPSMRLLATSREALGSAGEVPWRIPSLATPDPEHLPLLDDLIETAAVRLFVERARIVQPTFMVTADNAAAVARVCRRLDGIPLALELAVARLTALTPAQIAARLDDRFRLLTGGRRTALRRQQTLQAAIDWSHDLLTAPERVLLRRLAVFAGGWTLEAAEAVGAGDGIAIWQVLDLLTQLIEKSLVQLEEQSAEGRYRLLETVRQYAGEKLAASDEAAAVRDRHRDYCLALAEEAEAQLDGPDQVTWRDRLEAEHDNLRTALAWSHDQPDGGADEVRLAGALGRFWYLAGHMSTGRDQLAGALAAQHDGPPTPRARALLWLGWFAFHLGGDADRAIAQLEEALRLAREQDEHRLIARGLYRLAWAVTMQQGDLARAAELGEEGLARCRAAGDAVGIADMLNIQGTVAVYQGDRAQAQARFEESLAHCRRNGLAWETWVMLDRVGCTALGRGDFRRADEALTEGWARAQVLGGGMVTAEALGSLGALAWVQEEVEQAAGYWREALIRGRDVGYAARIPQQLERLARVARARRRPERAARLFGAAEALSGRQVWWLFPTLTDHEQEVAAVHAQLDERAYAAAWAEGQAMTLEEAVEYALAGDGGEEVDD